MDSDDLWLPNKLEKQLYFMGENIYFSFTAYELINEFGIKLKNLLTALRMEVFPIKTC
ncbi:hypothetical protein P4S63_13900 [Pseudoalteromonas sp. B193]